MPVDVTFKFNLGEWVSVMGTNVSPWSSQNNVQGRDVRGQVRGMRRDWDGNVYDVLIFTTKTLGHEGTARKIEFRESELTN